MSEQVILVEKRQRVLYITLNRPEKINALTVQMLEDLLSAVHAAEDDPEVGPIVIRGAGRGFCSGWDLTPSPERDRLGELSIQNDINTMARRSGRLGELWHLTKPIIAQVQGYCLAGGTDLALNCDIIIAAEDAQFGFPAVRSMGTPPTHMWTYLAGPQWAKRLLLTGDRIDGKTAARIGLVLEAVPEAELEAHVDRLASTMAKIPTDLLAQNKAICNKAVDLMGRTMLQQLALESDAIAHKSPDAQEFNRVVREKGLKAGLAWQNEKFS